MMPTKRNETKKRQQAIRLTQKKKKEKSGFDKVDNPAEESKEGIEGVGETKNPEIIETYGY